MGRRIQRHLIQSYPQIQHVFLSTGVIPKIEPRPLRLEEAVVRVVVGQMLSAAAAKTIYSRMEAATLDAGVNATFRLSDDALRACGLSRAKSRTVREFGAALDRDPQLLEDWNRLSSDEVMAKVKSFWGMSDWTASIIAIFYLGHEDVFPSGDGSLNRALALLEDTLPRRSKRIDPDAARPYRSYLALYLWRALDEGRLRAKP